MVDLQNSDFFASHFNLLLGILCVVDSLIFFISSIANYSLSLLGSGIEFADKSHHHFRDRSCRWFDKFGIFQGIAVIHLVANPLHDKMNFIVSYLLRMTYRYMQ